jgi:hypothetical protein
MESIQQMYIDNLPQHLWPHPTSVFYIMDWDSFEREPPNKLQDIFNLYHIVVTGVPQKRAIGFDRRGLEKLGGWKQTRTIQGRAPFQAFYLANWPLDLSTPPEAGDYSVRERQGTLQEFYEHATSSHGRILNVLDLPLPDGPCPDERLASDIVAWKATMNNPFCKKKVPFPLHESRWGMAATSSAQHMWHTDPDGVCTSIDVKVGIKYWVVGVKNSGSHDFVDLLSHDKWYYKTMSSNKHLWDSEGILLMEGTML